MKENKIKKSELKKYIPNILTTLRLMSVPFFVQQFLCGNFGIATAIFATASITDAIDGNLARKWKVESRYGKIVDPIADKTLVMSALLIYGIKVNPIMFISFGLEALIASVNITNFVKKSDIKKSKFKKISDIINFIMKNGKGDVNQIGRKKTVGLMTEISIALLTSALRLPATKLVNLLTLSTATLEAATLVEYIEKNKSQPEKENKEKQINQVIVKKDESIEENKNNLKEQLKKEIDFLNNNPTIPKQLKRNLKNK